MIQSASQSVSQSVSHSSIFIMRREAHSGAGAVEAFVLRVAFLFHLNFKDTSRAAVARDQHCTLYLPASTPPTAIVFLVHTDGRAGGRGRTRTALWLHRPLRYPRRRVAPSRDNQQGRSADGKGFFSKMTSVRRSSGKTGIIMMRKWIPDST